MDDENEKIEIDAFRPRPTQPLFVVCPVNDWTSVELSSGAVTVRKTPWNYTPLSDAYWRAAILLADALKSSGESKEDEVPLVFLFRHYLELSLKRIILDARRLKAWNSNALDSDVQPVSKKHELLDLWKTATAECQKRIPRAHWTQFDIVFVDDVIKQFHEIDPDGSQLRYSVEKLAVPAKPYPQFTLRSSIQDFLDAMQHVRGVLDMICSLLVEKLGENDEWHGILDSL